MNRLTKAILIFGILLILGGCWSRRELNDIAIVLGLGIDRTGEEYSVSVQIVNPGEIAARGGGGKGGVVLTQSEKAGTLAEALRKITTKAPRKLNLAHLRVIIFGEELARAGIGKTLDFLSRNHEVRADFAVLVAKGLPAEKVLRVYTVSQEPIPANKIYKSLETTEATRSGTTLVSMDDLLSDIESKMKYPALTGVELMGDIHNPDSETRENVESMKPLTVIRIAKLAVFKKDKLVGWFNENESRGYNYIVGNVRGSVEEIPCSDRPGKIAIDVIRTERKLYAKVTEGTPRGEVRIRMEANVAEAQCSLDLSSADTIRTLEELASKRIRELMGSALRAAQQKYKTDVFGFGDAIRRTDPLAWEKLEERWDQKFEELEVDLKVEVLIRRLGTKTDTADH